MVSQPSTQHCWARLLLTILLGCSVCVQSANNPTSAQSKRRPCGATKSKSFTDCFTCFAIGCVYNCYTANCCGSDATQPAPSEFARSLSF